MSDDLISRKALKQAIYTDFYEHFTQCHDSDQKALIDMVMNDIDEIPTAFDKEKVIEELKSRSGSVQQISGQAVSFMFADGYYNGIKDAITIIEKGGIE